MKSFRYTFTALIALSFAGSLHAHADCTTGVPYVEIDGPADQSTASGTVSLSAYAQEGDAGDCDFSAGITYLAIYIDGNVAYDSDFNSDYSDRIYYQWNTQYLTNGLHTVEAYTEDENGGSADVSIGVFTDNPYVDQFNAQGAIEGFANGVLTGWAIDKDTPAQAVQIDIYMDKKFIGSTMTVPKILRKDMDRAFHTSGAQEFTFTIPTHFLDDGKTHTLQAYADDTAGTTASSELMGSPLKFVAFKKPTGKVEAISPQGVATGWAEDASAPDTSLSVQYYIGGPIGKGTLVGTGTTDQFRLDINTKLNATGNHGFSFQIPSEYIDGKAHGLYVYAIDPKVSGGYALIKGSPKRFKFGTTTKIVPLAKDSGKASNAEF